MAKFSFRGIANSIYQFGVKNERAILLLSAGIGAISAGALAIQNARISRQVVKISDSAYYQGCNNTLQNITAAGESGLVVRDDHGRPVRFYSRDVM